MADIPEVLTTREAATAFRVSESTIRRWLDEGRLRGNAAIGRVTKESVNELLGVKPQQPKESDDAT
jgi:excisionase family DNA binding protein